MNLNENIDTINISPTINKVLNMKGKATIELFENGELVQKTEENNLVTNAAYNCVNPPIDIILKSYYNTSETKTGYLNRCLPLYSQIFSGIYLISENLEENKDNISPSWDILFNKIVGHAGGNYAGTSTLQGNLNTNESGFIDNGYKYVWDFGTDKANGIIKSIALTPYINGHNYDSSHNGSLSTFCFNELSYRNTTDNDNSPYYRYWFSYNNYNAEEVEWKYLDNSYIYGAGRSTGNIYRCKLLDITNISLNSIVITNGQRITLEKIWTNSSSVSSRCTYYNNFLYTWTRSGASSILRKFSINNYNVELIEEKIVTFNLPSGLSLYYSSPYNRFYDPETKIWYMFCKDSRTSTTVYGVFGFDENGDLIDDIYLNSQNYYNNIFILNLKDRKYFFIGSNGYPLLPDGKIMNYLLKTGSGERYRQLHYYNEVNYPYFLIYKNDDNSSYGQETGVGIARTLPLYSTINVLSTPINKTNTQTMKITYEITNAE